jgi:hypothetical protein
MASAKALSMAQEIRSALVQRGVSTVGEVSLDASDSNAAYILVGAGTAGSQSALIKVRESSPLGSDIVGNSAVGYAQVVCQIALEASSVGATNPELTIVNLLPLIGELVMRGSRVEVYGTADATAVTTLIGATMSGLKATFDPSVQFRLMAQS